MRLGVQPQRRVPVGARCATGTAYGSAPSPDWRVALDASYARPETHHAEPSPMLFKTDATDAETWEQKLGWVRARCRYLGVLKEIQADADGPARPSARGLLQHGAVESVDSRTLAPSGRNSQTATTVAERWPDCRIDRQEVGEVGRSSISAEIIVQGFSTTADLDD